MWVLRFLPWAGWFTTKQIVIVSFHVFPERLIFYWIPDSISLSTT